MHERRIALMAGLGGGLSVALAAWIAPVSIVSTLVVTFFLLWNAGLIGASLLPRASRIVAFFGGCATILGVQSLLQTAWYYAMPNVTPSALIALSGAAIALCSLLAYRSNEGNAEQSPSEQHVSFFSWRAAAWMAVTAFMVIVPVSFVLTGALSHATTQAIRTPWPLMPDGSLVALGVTGLALWMTAWRTCSPLWTAGLGAISLFGTLGIAPLLYRLGFGFDGFLHRASEQILSTTGTLTPKPFYYIGQYIFADWIHAFSRIPIADIDRWLVPVAALLLPFFFSASLPRGQRPFALAGFILLLPLAPFIATTPQSFAYVLGMAAVSLAFLSSADRSATAAPALILAAWSIAVHPLAGLPFFAAAALALWSCHAHARGKPILASPIPWVLLFFGVVAVPAAFFFRSGILSGGEAASLLEAFRPPAIRLVLWADFASFLSYVLPCILFLLALISSVKKSDERPLWILFFIYGAGLHAASWILKQGGDFSFLIDYERGNYADRLLLIGQLLWLFPAAFSLGAGVDALRKKTPLQGFTGFICLMIIAAAQSYLALPRHDAAVVGHGWSVGAADQEAVSIIDHDAEGKTYAVLANQSVSAAAVEAYGFRRYATDPSGDQIFYYPLPTGGPLYQLFLAMMKEPAKETATEASRLAQADIIYVVLNAYWWDAERTGEKLDLLAEKKLTTHDGQVRIYRFPQQ